MITPCCITSRPEELNEGLFGGVFLYVFEVLPYLQRRKIFPQWRIESSLYGTVIPGVLDLAYSPPDGHAEEISLSQLRKRYSRALGSNWQGVSDLWYLYFKVPARIVQVVDSIPNLANSLGVHYRGNDKSTSAWDTNPISAEDFALIVVDYLSRRNDIQQVFVATDDATFLRALRLRVNVKVWNGGVGLHHKTLKPSERINEAEQAVRDSLALSRCRTVLCTSSGLSAFAKIFNPQVEIYRCAASKFFADIPYFPIAYVPMHSSPDAIVQSILQKSLERDWTFDARAKRFLRPFVTISRASVLQRLKNGIKRVLRPR